MQTGQSFLSHSSAKPSFQPTA